MSFAFIIESVSGTEWLVLLGVILIVVGPKNLPAAARKMGQVMSTLRRAADEFKRQLMTMDQEITKAVSDEPSSSSSSSSTADGSGDSSSQVDPGEQSEPYVDPYQSDSPYPGHEDFYDETHYEDGSSPVEAQSDAPSSSDAAAADSSTGGQKTEAELNAVKITVSSASAGSRKRK